MTFNEILNLEKQGKMVKVGSGSERGYISRKITDYGDFEAWKVPHGRRCGCWKISIPRYDTTQYIRNIYYREI